MSRSKQTTDCVEYGGGTNPARWMTYNYNLGGALVDLPGRYASPDGILLLAYVEDDEAGCVAMRKVGEDICEMKRLFIREKFRGLKIGNALIQRVVDESRNCGYKRMRLDTLPDKMGKAVRLYKSHGFYEIPPYYENPYHGVLFMEKILS